ncbi:CheR family methyltransferase [Dawidia soli]|uniref:protein-glutamate O-methyltransferase n=1 Tax=Dawidia soli TaxID=2782352 RepID=A0AAP2D7M3_9BACT|nr:protein-glutamate O-methyltransferase CheR [Dawidia soli]MBT1686096.1 protein-glutamate O-methyltransferase CheR [Dawidia soli]
MAALAQPQKLSDADFSRLSRFIYKECGINLPPLKKILLESRLQKRLDHLHIGTFSAYCDYVMSPAGLQEELVFMIDAVATNKTDFFREPVHFDFMRDQLLPAWYTTRAPGTFKVWSSACSSGEEPYTIAMVLEEFALGRPFNYRIVASDISTKVLKKAIQAIYPMQSIAQVPMTLCKRYLLRSKDKDGERPTIRIGPRLRAKVEFKRINLIDDIAGIDADFDLIFCRNVLIYFDKGTQEMVLRKLLSKLRRGGYLFIGHSESVHHLNLPVQQVKPTIFRKL